MGATARNVDFSNVKDGGNFNRNRVPAGDYLAKIIKVEDAKAKDETFQYLFSIKLVKRQSSVFPYYCKLQENQLWKLRNILIAAGKAVPKSKVKVDVNSVVNKLIGVTIEDDEYDGKEQSTISAVFPASDLDDDGVHEEIVDDSEEEDEDDELEDLSDEEEPEAEEEPVADEFDSMDRLTLRKFLIKFGVQTKASQSDDDLRDLARKQPTPEAKPTAKPAAKPAAAKKKATEVTDDELEELDIDDL